MFGDKLIRADLEQNRRYVTFCDTQISIFMYGNLHHIMRSFEALVMKVISSRNILFLQYAALDCHYVTEYL